MSPLKQMVFLSAVSLLAYSCGNENSASSGTASDTAKKSAMDTLSGAPANTVADYKFHNIIANMPSPLELIDLLGKSHAAFDNNLVNPPGNESKYLTSCRKALNFGIYSMDLGYLASNEQYTDIQKFFTVSRSLAKALDAGESFDKVVSSRIRNYSENRDTILKVVDEFYAEVDNYLRSNDRLLAATEMLTGAWVETQYILLSTLAGAERNSATEPLYKKIGEQRFHLNNLCDLLKSYSSDKEFLSVIKGVSSLRDAYGAAGNADKAAVEKLLHAVSSVRNTITQ